MTRRATKPRYRPLERSVKKTIRACLEVLGCRVYVRNILHQKIGKHYVRAGETDQADLYGKLPDGRHFELEVKRPGERPRPGQLRWLLAMNGDGVKDRAVAYWSDNPADAEKVMRALIQGARVVYTLDKYGAPTDTFFVEYLSC